METRRAISEEKLGLGRRMLAFWIDLLLIFASTWLMARGVGLANKYLPFELSFLIVSSVYLAGASYAWGTTLGKAAFGLEVQIRATGTARLVRVLLRETLGKAISVTVVLVAGCAAFYGGTCIRPLRHVPYAIVVPIGMALGAMYFVAAIQSGRALHDILAGSRVIRRPVAPGITRTATLVAISMLAYVAGDYAYDWYVAAKVMRQMTSKQDFALPAAARDPETLADVATINEKEEIGFTKWLDESGAEPLTYAVEKAQQHQLVLLGEQHDQRQTLAFLNALIPAAYEKADVTVIAMEVFMASENANIERLVSAPEFDREAALALARRMDGWAIWGYKGYWDVMETVWRVNHNRPVGKPKMRLIGLGLMIDMPSLAMLGLEDNPGSNAPLWEKARAIRLVKALPAMVSRDAFMACEVQREIFEKDERGIVLVGSSHSMIRCSRPGQLDGNRGRLGLMLARNYPEHVFQIVTHQGKSGGNGAALPDLLERVMRRRDNRPVGFDVVNSPFALLRDSSSVYFRDKRIGFEDWATGYVFLAPRDKIQSCVWVVDYLSPSMFIRNKPFYQSFGKHYGQEIETAGDVNELFTKLADGKIAEATEAVETREQKSLTKLE